MKSAVGHSRVRRRQRKYGTIRENGEGSSFISSVKSAKGQVFFCFLRLLGPFVVEGQGAKGHSGGGCDLTSLLQMGVGSGKGIWGPRPLPHHSGFF